ncbi:MAG: hypothetical protein MUO75_03950 [Actinobacteria bacterium]|nr:hypothetical protein [Actinomycetota bacterium]
MIIGGQAVLLYGEPRLTRDIDITVGLGVDKVDRVLSVTKHLGLKTMVRNYRAFVNKTMVLPVIEPKTKIRVDFIFSFTEYEKQAIMHSRAVRLDNVSVRFASLEDVIVHKVVAGRARDIEDVRAVVLKNPKYDTRYIVKWLKVLDRSAGAGLVAAFRKTVREGS